MYQPKVKQTQQYSDSQGEHIVHEGKLVLLVQDKSKEKQFPCISSNINGGDWRIIDNLIRSPRYYYKPIIISETEEIEVGDWVYNIVSKHCSTNSHIYQITEKKQLHNSNQYKIIVLPEYFSDKQLQAIVDGKMKEEGVLVKCEKHWKVRNVGIPPKKHKTHFPNDYHIHLNQQNHITLFPVKQSLEEAAEKYLNIKNLLYKPQTLIKIFKAGAEWAKKNNY